MAPRAIDPEWRWKLLLEMVDKGRRPDDAFTAQVYDVIIGQEQDDDIAYALDLVRTREHKETLQAFFFCDAAVSFVSETLGISVTILEHVCKLVMDETQFRNRLERLSYIKDLTDSKDRLTERGREYVQLGMCHGPDVLGQHFSVGNRRIKLDPKKLIEHFIQTAYYLSANARGNSITAETTKQARLWMLDSLKYMEAHKDAISSADATDDALLAIEERKATVSVEEMGLTPDDIFH